jgi:ADP-ribose pyrophosphatase YjhB (NUDIX family)
MEDQILEWAKELQSIAQAGLFYGRDVFDRERYQRIREIAARMLSMRADLPMDKVVEVFCSDTGYQTPKVDSRAAVFRDGRILLVRENDGRWSLPGGWCEYNLAPADNAVKEAKEEAGVDVTVKKLIAVHDKNKHNPKPYLFSVIKIFYLCELTGGEFVPNIETSASGFFSLEELPEMAEEKCSAEQVRMCFAAAASEHWTVQFD